MNELNKKELDEYITEEQDRLYFTEEDKKKFERYKKHVAYWMTKD